jgi:hypothetical protein
MIYLSLARMCLLHFNATYKLGSNDSPKVSESTLLSGFLNVWISKWRAVFALVLGCYENDILNNKILKLRILFVAHVSGTLHKRQPQNLCPYWSPSRELSLLLHIIRADVRNHMVVVPEVSTITSVNRIPLQVNNFLYKTTSFGLDT